MQIFDKDTIWVETAKKAKVAQQMRKKFEEEEKLHLEKLKDLSQDLPAKGGGFVYNFSLRKGTVDYKAIPVLQGLDLEPFRGAPIKSWRLEMEVEVVVIEVPKEQ